MIFQSRAIATVILSEAKNLLHFSERFFASLRMTGLIVLNILFDPQQEYHFIKYSL